MAKMKNKRSRKRTRPGSHFTYNPRYMGEDATDRWLTVGMSRTSDGETVCDFRQRGVSKIDRRVATRKGVPFMPTPGNLLPMDR